MGTLLRTEFKKLRRSSIVWITIFATILIAAIVFAEGLQWYDGPDVEFGLKTVHRGSRYIDNAGWYMDEAQPLSTIFVLPAVISLLGSYVICREEDDGTINALHLIPIDEAKLTAAKMMVAFTFSIFLYLLLFAITFLTEAVLHFSDLTAPLVLGSLKEYALDGVGVFLAISPIIALVAHIKKGYWLALVFTEIYSCAALFASMSSALKNLYPIAAVFCFSGYDITSAGKRAGSVIILLACGFFAALILKGLNARKRMK